MSDGDKTLVSDALRILHGARSLPPVEAAEALRPFLDSMRREAFGDKLADASTAAVTELVRSLKDNQRRLGRSVARGHRGDVELCERGKLTSG
jgi:hypothetical protein